MKTQGKIQFWPMMITVFLGSFVIMLSSSTINIAIPFLMKNFNTDLDTVKWALTGFMLSMGTTAPVAAFFGEKFSYKRLYLTSIIGFTFVSMLAVFAGNIYLLIAIRILQGFFGGVTIPATMALIYQTIPKEKQVMAICIWSIAPTLAPAVGPTLSGFLIQSFSWKAIFILNVPLGLMAIIMGLINLPYYKLSINISLDILGIILSVLTSTSLLIAFSEGSVWGWGSPVILLLLIFGVLFMIIFVWWELHTKTPLLNLRVFKYPKFLFGVIVSCIINIALYSGIFMTPIFLQQIQGMSPLDSGLVLLPASITMAILMPIVGKLYKRIGTMRLIITGVLLISIGTWRMSHLSIDTTHNYIRSWMALRYIGLAIATMPVSYAAMSILPKEVSGHASSIMNWIKQMVACLSIGIFSSLMSIRISSHFVELSAANTNMSAQVIKTTGSVMGINDVYLISCIIILVALPFSFFLNNKVKDSALGENM